MKTLWLATGGDRHKQPVKLPYRFMTFEEASTLHPGARVSFLARDGTARMVTVNGTVRRWKRDPGRMEIPAKYGMYEYATFHARPATDGTVKIVSDDPGVALLVPLQAEI